MIPLSEPVGAGRFDSGLSSQIHMYIRIGRTAVELFSVDNQTLSPLKLHSPLILSFCHLTKNITSQIFIIYVTLLFKQFLF